MVDIYGLSIYRQTIYMDRPYQIFDYSINKFAKHTTNVR